MTSTSEKLETIHAVSADLEAVFTWDYERSRPALGKLYEKAKTSQWNASTDLDWSIDVDPEKIGQELGGGGTMRFQALAEAENSPVKHFGDREWRQISVEIQNSLAVAVPARRAGRAALHRAHRRDGAVDRREVLRRDAGDGRGAPRRGVRPLPEREARQPVRDQPEPQGLLDEILSDPRWDITYLGMQIMVEGLALAAFGMMHMVTTEPLLKKLLRYVMSDESRHVAFGVLSLQEFYKGLTDVELRERQEFAFDVAQRLQRRFAHAEMWERMGVDSEAVYATMTQVNPPAQRAFQSLLFSKIVPNCKKLGLLDASGGWLRERFQEIDVIQFEDWVDTGEEYDSLDEVAKDRQESTA